MSDNPMPADAMDHVSLHSAKSPPPLFHSQSFSSVSPTTVSDRFAKPHLKFEEEDVVHQYGYGRNDEPTHYSRHHPANPYQPAPGQMMPGRPSAQRSFSGGLYPPVPEVDEDASADSHASTEDPSSAALEKGARYYADPYRAGPEPATPASHRQPGTESRRMETAASAKSHESAAARIGQLFHFSQSADPSRARSAVSGEKEKEKERDAVRGGVHRGVKDYPHLRRGESGRGQQEKDERAKLVQPESDDEGASRRSSVSSRHSYRDEHDALEMGSVGLPERTYAQPQEPAFVEDNDQTPRIRDFAMGDRRDAARLPSPLPRSEQAPALPQSVPMGHERQRTTSSSGGSGAGAVGLGVGAVGAPRVQGPRGPRGPTTR